jgi:hypothetical protein
MTSVFTALYGLAQWAPTQWLWSSVNGPREMFDHTSGMTTATTTMTRGDWNKQIYGTWNLLAWVIRFLYFNAPEFVGCWGGHAYSTICSRLSHQNVSPDFWNERSNAHTCVQRILIPHVSSIEVLVEAVVGIFLVLKLMGVLCECLRRFALAKTSSLLFNDGGGGSESPQQPSNGSGLC